MPDVPPGAMLYTLSRSFVFEAAHTLQRPLHGDSSQRIHGHTYRASVHLQGQLAPDSNMLLDLAVLDRHMQNVRQQLDHRFLDEVAGLGPATLENLCTYIWQQLQINLPALVKVSVERGMTGDACSLTCSNTPNQTTVTATINP
ncbi:6-pyruvoyl trahydropterin synthase family protein [Undibacterium hunanense]|nr:6-carboxytetrahydropterin synthase [Undibacterium hunanense]